MVTRKTQTAKAVEAAAPAPEQIVDDEISLLDMMRDVGASIGVEIPTGKQMIAGSVTMVIVSILGSYSAIQVASYVAVGAAMLTGSAFIAFALAMIVAVLGFVAALIAASRASAYVASGQLEKNLVSAKNYVTGFFRRAPETVAEATAS